MKYPAALAAFALSATAAAAEERQFLCVSNNDGSEVNLTRNATGDKGTITTPSIQGEATVLKGVGNVTFLYIEGQDVMTFVVTLDDLSYDLSISGPKAGNDRGQCQELDV